VSETPPAGRVRMIPALASGRKDGGNYGISETFFLNPICQHSIIPVFRGRFCLQILYRW